MKNVIDLHHEAMELAAQAMLLDLQGDSAGARVINRQAFLKEKQAAELITKMANTNEIEPNRSVLCRSAATLALRCGEFAEVKRLVELGLSGNPPAEIAKELNDVLNGLVLERIEHVCYIT